MQSKWEGDTLIVTLSRETEIDMTLRAKISVREFDPRHSIMHPLPFGHKVSELRFVFNEGKSRPHSNNLSVDNYRKHVALVVRCVLINLGLK